MYTYTLTEGMEESSAKLATNYDRDVSKYLRCLWKQDIGLQLMLLCSSGRCQSFYLGNVARWYDRHSPRKNVLRASDNAAKFCQSVADCP
jgi:hypothetical protein